MGMDASGPVRRCASVRILVTGGLGFIGSNFIRLDLRNRPDVQVVTLDVMTYAGNPANLADVESEDRYRFYKGDICDPAAVEAAIGEDPDKRDYIVSNDKLLATGFAPRFSLDQGIKELIRGYTILRNTIYSNV